MQNQPHIESWYAASAIQQLDFPPLQGETATDVCVIGAGYTGLSAAIHLRQLGYNVTVLEANRVGWGASGRNGGHVGTGQRAEQDQLEKLVGLEQATALWQLGLEAVDTVSQLIEQYNIDCEFKRGDLHVASKAKETGDMQAEVDHLQQVYDYRQIRYVDKNELAQMTSGRGFHGGRLDVGARHLHPLNYALGLAKAASDLGAHMHEGSRVLSYSEGDAIRIKTDHGEVRARFLVLACNGYLE
jgi:gamma-glutamylputrescine oxidase